MTEEAPQTVDVEAIALEDDDAQLNAILPEASKWKLLEDDADSEEKVDELDFKEVQEGTRLRSQVRIKVGTTHVFDSQNGDFLGRWSLELSTYRHHTFKCVLFDPQSIAYEEISKQDDIEVQIGFADGIRPTIFKGKLYFVGRIPPDGTEIEAVDPAFQMQSTTGPSVQQAGEGAAQAGLQNGSELVDGMKVVNTLEGEASFYGGGDGFDGQKTANGEIFDATKMTAAHKELDFGTKCRVTNPENKKDVIVTINDRGPYSGDRIIDLSKAAAEAIGIVDKGHGKVKIEVLGDAQSETSPEEEKKKVEETTVAQGEPTTPVRAASPDTAPISTRDGFDLSDTSGLIATSSIPGGDSFQSLILAKTLQTKKNSPVPGSPSFGVSLGFKFPGLKINPTSLATTGEKGSIQINGSYMNKAQLDAMLEGKVIVTQGDEVKEISPGQAPKSGIKIDYAKDFDAFVGSPRIFRRKPIQLQSGYGAMTVKGYSVNDASPVSATVVTTGPGSPLPPGAQIEVPQLGSVTMDGPLYPGCPFTWVDVLVNGKPAPQSQEVLEGIFAVAKTVQQILVQFNISPDQAHVTSWYRPESAGSYHSKGSAVDWYIDDGPGSGFGGFDYTRLYKVQEWALANHNGGVGRGIEYQGFLHIDTGPKRDWDY
jgi:rare lipoprotein A (peptidoglycan hydrolase)